jgi:hypothetical protein
MIQLNSEDIIIDDSVLTKNDIDEIKHLLIDDFPWYLGTGKQSTVIGDEYASFKNNQQIFEYGQFTHKFVDDGIIYSKYYDIISKIIKNILKKYSIGDKLLRAKSNLMTKVTPDKNALYNTPHTDDTISHWVVIYYVLDSDGDTFIFNETDLHPRNLTIKKQVSPKQGRILIFDGKFLHAGMHPSKHDYRSVINFNFAK